MNTTSQLPPTSLIIPSRNRPQLLLETVASVLRGAEVPTELIIIDQSHTTHPSLSALTTERSCEIRYVWTRSVGVSRARNEGIRAARYAMLVFTDDDVLVEPTWFQTIVTALINAGHEGVVTGQVRPAEPILPGSFVPSTITDAAPKIHTGRIYADVLYPPNMAMYSSTLEQLGLFDERLGAGTPFLNAEDNDLGFRLLETGHHISYTPTAIVYHRAWRTAKDYLPLRWKYGFGQGAFYAKHLSWKDFYMLRRLRRDLQPRIMGFPVHLLSERRRAAGNVVYTCGLLCGMARWLLTQRKARASSCKN